MNAAFLIVASAFAVNADAMPAKPAAPAMAAPAATAAPIASSCSSCSSCSTSCGCEEKPGLLDRIKARFAHSSCGCETSCSTCAAPVPIVHSHASCECDPCAHKFGFGDKLKGFFARFKSSDCGCSTCGSTCDSCGTVSAAPATITAPAAPATTPPAKMPNVPAGEPIKAPKDGGKGVTLAPTLQSVPTAAKPAEELKSPF